MTSSFRTVETTGVFELVEKRSRFIGVAAPVDTVDAANAILADLKKEHYNARHHCFAYQMRTGETRYSDDGEPSKTGGFPALQLLQGGELVNVVVVLVRYYGGVKLGTGGLSRAYRDAARGAIDAAVPITIHPEVELKLTVPYQDWDKFQHQIDRRPEVVSYHSVFDHAVQLELRVLADEVAEFDQFLELWQTISR